MLTPILMYHEVTEAGRLPEEVLASWTVTPEQFREHLAMLAGAGYTGVSAAQWLHTRQRRAPGLRPVVLTFDDGFRGNVDHAIPALLERGWTATFFVISGRMGRPSYAAPEDWRAAAAAGMDIASHTATHPFMAVLDVHEARRELTESRAALEDATGAPVVGFSWPNGDAHPRGRGLLTEAGYTWAATSRAAFAAPRTDRLALPRLPVRAWHDAEALAALLGAGRLRRTRMAAAYAAKQLGRRCLGRARYARIQSRIVGDVQGEA